MEERSLKQQIKKHRLFENILNIKNLQHQKQNHQKCVISKVQIKNCNFEKFNNQMTNSGVKIKVYSFQEVIAFYNNSKVYAKKVQDQMQQILSIVNQLHESVQSKTKTNQNNNLQILEQLQSKKHQVLQIQKDILNSIYSGTVKSALQYDLQAFKAENYFTKNLASIELQPIQNSYNNLKNKQKLFKKIQNYLLYLNCQKQCKMIENGIQIDLKQKFKYNKDKIQDIKLIHKRFSSIFSHQNIILAGKLSLRIFQQMAGYNIEGSTSDADFQAKLQEINKLDNMIKQYDKNNVPLQNRQIIQIFARQGFIGGFTKISSNKYIEISIVKNDRIDTRQKGRYGCINIFTPNQLLNSNTYEYFEQQIKIFDKNVIKKIQQNKLNVNQIQNKKRKIFQGKFKKFIIYNQIYAIRKNDQKNQKDKQTILQLVQLKNNQKLKSLVQKGIQDYQQLVHQKMNKISYSLQKNCLKKSSRLQKQNLVFVKDRLTQNFKKSNKAYKLNNNEYNSKTYKLIQNSQNISYNQKSSANRYPSSNRLLV